MRLVLASASPRRAELLSAAGFRFEVLATDVDETVRDGEPPRDYVRRLAMEKSARALDLCAATADTVIVAADTSVIVDGEILGKPIDDRDSERMLRRLAGRVHVVLTGVSVRSSAGQLDCVEETRVFVKRLSEADVQWYVASGEGRDKAGGYAIQGLAARFIPRIEGSYSNVVGLPVEAASGLIGRIAQGVVSGVSRA